MRSSRIPLMKKLALTFSGLMIVALLAACSNGRPDSPYPHDVRNGGIWHGEGINDPETNCIECHGGANCEERCLVLRLPRSALVALAPLVQNDGSRKQKPGSARRRDRDRPFRRSGARGRKSAAGRTQRAPPKRWPHHPSRSASEPEKDKRYRPIRRADLEEGAAQV